MIGGINRGDIIEKNARRRIYDRDEDDDVSDGDLDDEHDYGLNEEEGYFGINIHAASSSPYKRDQVKDEVGVWSAGCQVFKSSVDFRSFMALCRKQRKERSWDTFTYSLVEW